MPRKPVIPRLAEVPPLPGARYVTLYFEPRSSKLVSDSLTLLQQQPDSLSGVLGARPQASLIVVGHADTRSDGDRAALAAARRAESVQQQLVQLGIPAGRIAVRSSGVNEPRFSGGELALNCRVELYVYDPSARPGWNLGSAGLLKTAYLPEAAASVRFQPYSALLDPEATRALDRFLETRIAAPKPKRAVRVRLTGLIDPAETAMPSGPLARGRVEAVRSYLLSAGLGAGLVEVDATPGVGRDPADAGRRVELRVIGG
jgi:outer membrane protein OmpA-like peptidoglycan-associated protein